MVEETRVENGPSKYLDKVVGDLERASGEGGLPTGREGDGNGRSGRDYEEFCSEILKAAGWSTRLTTRSGDQGVDIIALKGLHKVVIQCKGVSGTVGNSAVQEALAGKEFEQATSAVVVATGAFTASARQLAGISKVTLLHDSELHRLEDLL